MLTFLSGVVCLFAVLFVLLPPGGNSTEVCTNSTFECSVNNCVNIQDVCDGEEECPYGNDERYCGGCPSNWHYWRDHLYFIETEKKNFDESQAACENLGGHLTSVLDPEETEFLLYLAVPGVNYWIGFTDREEEGNYLWLDGSQRNYTNWTPGQPNNVPPEENCAEILATADRQDPSNGKWNDLRCIFLITYFCKKPVTGGNEEIQLLLFGATDIIQASIPGGCSMPLGMGNNGIKDHQISASSYIDDAYKPQYARLLNQSFWMPSLTDSQPWIEVNFEEQMIVAGLIVDGHLSMDLGWIWVDKFHVTYSNNGRLWKPYEYVTDNDKCGQYFCKKARNSKNEEYTVFSSRFACRRSLLFYYQIKAKHIRLHPNVTTKSYAERIRVGCKLEIIGCQNDDCDYSFGVAAGGITNCDYSFGVAAGGITNINMSTSSNLDNMHSATTARVRIIPDVGAAGTGWIPLDADSNPWLRVQMDSVHNVRAIVTQGCGDMEAWVMEYCISFTHDNNSVVFYQSKTSNECKVFQGNDDNIALVKNSLEKEIITDDMYFQPISWRNRPCLRLELVGCAAEIQRCEIDHVASCDFTRVCSYPKGQIASLNFPTPYPQRTSCTWNIITEPGTYILLSFIDFDIPSLGDCTSSSVTVYNGDTQSDDSVIGVYCNYRTPPTPVVGAFNHVFVALTSGAEESGRGFYGEYAQRRHETSIELPTDPGGAGGMCPLGWTHFRDNCYRLMYSDNYINWVDAEDSCIQKGAHLVSIRDSTDMEFIHSVIVDSLERYVSLPMRTYIGLTLHRDEWLHKWVDGRPLSYTDWISPKSEDEWTQRQPDGGRLESCVLIDLANVHSTNHWRDVPCVSENEARQYICMKPQSDGYNVTLSVTENLLDTAISPDGMTVCSNGEWSHKVFACDHTSECLTTAQCEQLSGVALDSSHIIRGECKAGEFQCVRSRECISVSFLCDFIAHCEDASDEEACVYPPCKEDEFTCSEGQCISISKRCDLINDCITSLDEELCDEVEDSFQCYDGTWLPVHAQCDGQRDCSGKNWEDESFSECDIYQSNFSCSEDQMTCKNGACVHSQCSCVYDRDKYGFMQGCRDASHLEQCGDVLCDNDMAKCSDSYCIPLRYRCDGSFDCPNGEDENKCETFQCPNHYRCKGAGHCLSHTELCDGIQQCPDGDDELFCGIECPEDCVCLGLYVSCFGSTWDVSKAALLPEDARQLHLVNLINPTAKTTAGTIDSRLHVDLSRMAFLILVDFSGNAISTVDETTFRNNRNLQVLCLAYNNITTVANATFFSLEHLKYLDMSGNPLKDIQPGAFLNLRSLQFLHSDKYLFCCLMADLELTECLPQADQFSSCEDLIRIPVLRIFMWILGISALLGNAYVIAKRIVPLDKGSRRGAARVQNIMVGHLAVADSLMGVYMMIIASADVYYRDRYAFFAEQWQTSIVCKVAGLLSVLSSEASVFFMTVISIDRFLACVFPFSGIKLSSKSAVATALIVWIIAFILSLVPVMIPSYFGNAFYGRSTVCLALPLTNARPSGWEYSVALFLAVNLCAFVVMLICYLSIYCTVQSSSVKARRDKHEVRAKEIQLALRMSFLVFSDMCCWMPIVLMGILSLGGVVDIPPSSYAWIAVFVLPLNSSLNPYLYTILTREMTKRQNAKKANKENSFSSDVVMTNVNTVDNDQHTREKAPDLIDVILSLDHDMAAHNILLSMPLTAAGGDEFIPLTNLGKGRLNADDLQAVVSDIEIGLKYLHDHRIVLCLNSISEDNIVIRKTTSDITAFLVVSNLRAAAGNVDVYQANRTRLGQMITQALNEDTFI